LTLEEEADYKGVMTKQYNAVEKRKRRKQYLKRKKKTAKGKKGK
jgi:hypothetical protein